MNKLTVTFRNRSGREWVAIFDLGSDYENNRCALSEAWKHGASIVRTERA